MTQTRKSTKNILQINFELSRQANKIYKPKRDRSFEYP